MQTDRGESFEENTPVNEWIRYGLRLGVSVALHPFEYSKFLIQMGYEPIAPRPCKTMFGHNASMLPNIFQYAGHIKKSEGLIGCYVGVGPKILGNILSSYGSDKVAEKLGLGEIVDKEKTDCEMTDDEIYNRFEKTLKRDIVVHVSGIVISQPFHVISLRMMAEFVGREGKYTSLFGSIGEIYREQGIFGFFCGFIPRLLFDISCLVLTSTTTYLVNKHFISDPEARQYFSSFIQLVGSSVFYPLQVVSTCMVVSGSGLFIGKPPSMPVYANWLDCWNHLRSTNQLKRGSSLFWRYHRPSSNPSRQLASKIPMPDFK